MFRRRDELINSITQVNVFFVDMERRLLAELQSSSSTDDGVGREELYGRVSDLRSHVILNYLAVLKIAKKHDKHSPNHPIRQQVAVAYSPACSPASALRGPSLLLPSSELRLAITLPRQAVDHMSGLSFYLSLEHSYLFAECRHHLQADIDDKLEGFARGAALQAEALEVVLEALEVEGVEAEGMVVEGVDVVGELELPAHFERCCLGTATGEREPLYDQPGARAVEQSPVNLKISRMLGLASRARKSEISASLPVIDQTDAIIAARHAARQAMGKESSSSWSASGERAAAVPSRGSTDALEEDISEEDMIFVLSGCEGEDTLLVQGEGLGRAPTFSRYRRRDSVRVSGWSCVP